MGKTPRDSWVIIERIVRRYPESKREYERAYQDMLATSPESISQDIRVNGGLPDSPTERAVIKMLDNPRMQRLYREIQAVEEVYNQLPEEYQKVIQIRFWSNRKRNIPYFQMTNCTNYKEAQLRRISGKFVRNIGKKLGEL